MRWLSQAPYSGSEIGECYAIAHLINDGDSESWLAVGRQSDGRLTMVNPTYELMTASV
jgi:hypothetical protein